MERRVFTDEQKKVVVDRYRAGEKAADLAKEFGIHLATVSNWAKRLNGRKPDKPRPEPAKWPRPPSEKASKDALGATRLRTRVVELEKENAELTRQLDRRTRALAEVSTRLALNESA